jgi:hypothetical protein
MSAKVAWVEHSYLEEEVGGPMTSAARYKGGQVVGWGGGRQSSGVS